jgi:Fic family protein
MKNETKTAKGLAIQYQMPGRWLHYDHAAIMAALIEAKAAVQALQTLPYQRSWVDKLQEIQLKREVAGTSRIEGAEFTERELELAIRPDVTPEQLITRSQRQAHAAMQTYRWLATVPVDRPVLPELIREVHSRLVTGCDDDHCPPGTLRGRDHNVTFGVPRHRGVEGGSQCIETFASLLRAFETEFRGHDALIQALALHYHLAAMHPFLDGNGRTARAAEALVLQRAGLTDRAFIAMSNYYYDEKAAYLTVLSETRARQHDLTPFLLFGLKGIKQQCEALTAEIRVQMKKALFRDTMYSLFNRLETKRKRVIRERQIQILKVLLKEDEAIGFDLYEETAAHYVGIKDGISAYLRDLSQLENIGAVLVNRNLPNLDDDMVSLNLDWPQQIDESEFMRKIKLMPKGKKLQISGLKRQV